MRGLVAWVWACLVVVGLSGCDGCEQGEPVGVTDRVWVTNLPDDPRQSLKILWIFDLEDAGHIGGFIVGSQYRNRHERFRYHPLTEGSGRIELLQDQRVHRVRATRCEPTEGFDLCMVLHGDPSAGQGATDPAHGSRYLSREEWERDASDGVPNMEGVLGD